MNSLRLAVATSIGAAALGSATLVAAFGQGAPIQKSTRMLPMPDVVERALAVYPGRLLEAEREQENDRIVYELEIVDEDGRMLELHYDAFTGELLKTQEEHDTVYDMRRSGRILPLSDILKRARQVRPGELLEADLDDEGGRYIYELEMIGDDGLHREFQFDAETGELLGTELDDSDD